jgi:hypothetical protein
MCVGNAAQVPGGANDSLSSNTHLGRAVQDACNELETLGGLVRRFAVKLPGACVCRVCCTGGLYNTQAAGVEKQ